PEETDAHRPPRLIPAGQLTTFFVVAALFFLWAIPNNLNDILIRQFMKSFAISRTQAGLVQFAFYIGYFCFALPASLVTRKAGYKAGILTGLCLFGTGALLFWPAALADRYSYFLIALFVIASGLSFLESSSNPFIAEMGDPRTSERRLNLAQAFNPVGSVTGAFLGTTFIFSGIELRPNQIAALQTQHRYQAYLRSEILRVVHPYMVLAGVVLFWAILVARTKFPAVGTERRADDVEVAGHGTLLRWHFAAAVIAQFLYVGAQVGTWSYLIQYAQQYGGAPERLAGYLLTGSLIAFGIGRFFSAWLMRFVRPHVLTGIYALINTVLAAFAVLHPGWAGFWCLFITSFFMSLMFPTIFALGIKELGDKTKFGSSILVMSIIGGAVLTLVMGRLSDMGHGVALAYAVPAVAYCGVALYAFFVSQPRTRVA
ncbi:MAG TPA: L-fucose:H+ symporter permease, partial [Acidobacteriaceae bacterium]|nr:L-fucose:H+ symporter permease [Acidobacteriaceae bacterium]